LYIRNRRSGATIVETAASLLLFLPILFTFLFVVLEVSTAFLIKEALAQGARQAARNLAVAYGSNHGIASSRAQQNTLVFDGIRITNIIASSAQFTDPQFNPNANPPTVTVSVNYTSNQNGLPVFPNPDPLHLGGSLKLSSTSTYRLE
jgi:Flp pilus assembly protein TadG